MASAIAGLQLTHRALSNGKGRRLGLWSEHVVAFLSERLDMN